MTEASLISLAVITLSVAAVRLPDCKISVSVLRSAVVAHAVLGLAYEGKKQYASAISEFHKAEELSGGRGAYYKGLLGHAYAVAGSGTDARKMLAELNAMAIEGNYAGQTSKATIYAGLGEKENALGRA